MGNSVGGGRKKAKVMKINGETMKLKTPIRAEEVIKNNPGHVLLESEAVKRFGIRAEPLEGHHELRPKKIYFLVELPKMPLVEEEEEERAITTRRRVKSGIHVSAKDRLEWLMLSRRSVSDLRIVGGDDDGSGRVGQSSGPVRVKMRLPKAQVAKLIEESRDEAEMGEKIIDLYVGKSKALNQPIHSSPDSSRSSFGLDSLSQPT